MQPTIAVLNGVIFLIPGVLALWIGEWLSGRKEESLFDRIAAALILSIPVYIAYRLLAAELGLGALGVIISDADPLSPSLSGLDPWAWAVLVGISSIAGLAYGAYTWRRLTFDPWVRTFKAEEARAANTGQRRWIWVRCRDGTQIIGLPARYSVEPDRRELFITDVEVFDQQGNLLRQIEGPGVLLVGHEQIIFIAFLDPPRG
jgi:Family of unknown function (DUF6338)